MSSLQGSVLSAAASTKYCLAWAADVSLTWTWAAFMSSPSPDTTLLNSDRASLQVAASLSARTKIRYT